LVLERWLRRNPPMHDMLAGAAKPSLSDPLVWFDHDEDDGEADWWPPDYVRGKSPSLP
jgi:hypothetical protein